MKRLTEKELEAVKYALDLYIDDPDGEDTPLMKQAKKAYAKLIRQKRRAGK